MTVRARKPGGPPSHPMVPHYHTCRGCKPRHRYRCLNAACDWNVLRDCPEAKK